VTLEADHLRFARMLRNLPLEARPAFLEGLPEGIDRTRVGSLVELGPEARKAMRDDALLLADDLEQQLWAVTDPSARALLAEELTFQQMLANAMEDAAYIDPGAVAAFVIGESITDPHTAYEAAVAQFDMIVGHVHEAGGIRRALRHYEILKYINRCVKAIEATGVSDIELTWLRNWSELGYKVDRSSIAETRPARPGPEALVKDWETAGVRYSDFPEPPPTGVSVFGPEDKFLIDNYELFLRVARKYIDPMRSRAVGP